MSSVTSVSSCSTRPQIRVPPWLKFFAFLFVLLRPKNPCQSVSSVVGLVAAAPRCVDSCPFVVKTAVPVGAHFSKENIAIRQGYSKIHPSAASLCDVRVSGKNASVRRDSF